MRIEAIDLFYLAMPEITTDADGSQDALLVRVRAEDGQVGFGECEAAPLPSIAAVVCPMSHGVCRPVGASVLGRTLESPADIATIAAAVAYDSMDLLQAAHAWSGIEMALWDLLGRARGQPVWRLLGQTAAHPKQAYASALFGDTPAETLARARAAVAAGFRAVKFGWGPFGRGSVEADRDQLQAAREGLGADGTLLVDAGQIFGEDVEAAARRLPALVEAGATWLEEPFAGAAYHAYAELAARSPIKLAGGEAAHSFHHARHLIDYGRVGFVQVDTGRIGGIRPARQVARYADRHGARYVNHTFTSHLALSASLQPFADLADHRLCEFPVAPKPLALAITKRHLTIDPNGELRPHDAPGLGLDVDLPALAPWLVDCEIKVGGRVLYRTPALF